MALTGHLFFPPLLPHSLHRSHLNLKPNPIPSFRSSGIRAVGSSDMLGDIGARDPFPAEIASSFAEKVLGNVDTEHKILIPNVSALSLSQQQCTPLSPFQPPMSTDEAQKLLRKGPFTIPGRLFSLSSSLLPPLFSSLPARRGRKPWFASVAIMFSFAASCLPYLRCSQ
ncbi:hypothetical protein CJ030_MR8G001616 [Morella rubra]|uniref:Uncharacterized protein n=1 Tax=Morella rubra TaxID=262757 RepID=A0A6A1UUF7_9ROSI|nr:hypothetical protein CJ030_MR8G001616 [Morella rubra]